MKTLKNITYLLLVIFLATSCENDYDAPPLNMPEYTGAAPNITIAGLKEKYASVTSAAPVQITESSIVKVRVGANDISGNIFKQLIMQDETGGLSFGVDQSNIYTTYRVGQEVFVDLKGLYVVNYGGELQIGYGNTNANRIPWQVFKDQAHLNAWPDSTLVAPKVVANFSELKTNMTNTVVQLNDVYFVNGGKSTFAVNDATTSQALKDKDGNSMDVRTSNYATFAKNQLPSGTGTLIGVLGRFNGNWQFTIRTVNDIKDFSGDTPINPSGKGTGTKEDPYDITNAIAKQGETGKWVKGYIVGSVPDKTLGEAQFKAPFTNAANILIAASATETDPNKCFTVQLLGGSDVRTALNLVDHPSNLGKEVLLKGDLTAYFGVPGIKNTSEYVFDGGTTPPVDPGTGSGTGTEADPYNIANAIAKQGETGKWIMGYIVGSVPDKLLSEAQFRAPFTAATNILIAASATETDPNKCFTIQLPAGDVRTGLNLKDNAANLGKQVKLQGDLIAYFGVPGMKNTSRFTLVDGGTTPPVNPGTSDGSKENPFSVSDLAGKEGKTGVWTEAYIVGSVPIAALEDAEFAAPFTSETNILIAASANEKDVTKCIPVQLPSALRTALGLKNKPGNLGQKVKLKGDIATYFKVVGIKNTSEYELLGK